MIVKSPLQAFNLSEFDDAGIKVFIKRDDLLHPIISGNKWRKLKYNLLHARQQQVAKVISFGGAYSNHIHALAFACQQLQLPSLAIIRGESTYQHNFTLRWARHWGMQLQFVDRQTYRLREHTDFLEELKGQQPNSMIIPEGGSNQLALRGVGEVIDELTEQCEFDYLLTPVGSGGTLAGLIAADNNRHTLLGIAVLKQQDYLEQQVKSLLAKDNDKLANWQIVNRYHGGGYGKFSRADIDIITDVIQRTKVPFEPVYSGKMLIALLDKVKQGYFAKGSRIVLLHTGGLQGLGGMLERQKINASDFIMPMSAP